MFLCIYRLIEWNLCEQIIIAAFDYGDESLGTKYLLMLQKQFPKSLRVNRLVGMHAEFRGIVLWAIFALYISFFLFPPGEYGNALLLYEEMLLVQPGNLPIMKRKVSKSLVVHLYNKIVCY